MYTVAYQNFNILSALSTINLLKKFNKTKTRKNEIRKKLELRSLLSEKFNLFNI